PTVAPSEHSVATLRTDGTAKTFPSGTAVQAYIDELLNLADGSVRIDPPFATDLLLYRDFAGSAATSVFHLAPTTDAAKVTLRNPMRGTFTIDNAKFATANRQLLVAEVLGKTAYGKVLRIAATTTVAATQAPGVKIFTTATPDAVVPLEGIIRDGQYLLLSADAPIAYAYGTVRAAGGAAAIANALVQSGLGS